MSNTLQFFLDFEEYSKPQLEPTMSAMELTLIKNKHFIDNEKIKQFIVKNKEKNTVIVFIDNSKAIIMWHEGKMCMKIDSEIK